MNDRIETARAKLLKAASLVTQASQILIKEQGGNQAVQEVATGLLKAAANLPQGASIGGPARIRLAEEEVTK